MNHDDPIEHERKGAKVGLNPMFGDWQHRFMFPPVPYRDGGTKLAAFKKSIRTALPNRFFYSREVSLEITLYLDIQTVLETSETADLDNYAKAILDGLKGPEGVLLDDTQVQALAISWLDKHRVASQFNVAISSSPDDFIVKPVTFYEMPNRLWYPVSRRMWTDGEIDEQSDRNHYANLLMLEVVGSTQTSTRHLLRTGGMDRFGAYQRTLYISSSDRGYHKSRIDAGFDMCDRKSWHAEFELWKQEHVDEFIEIATLLAGIKENYARMGNLLAGNSSDEDGSRS